MKYIIGLGNPGEQYANTRHNIGRSCLLELATTAGFSSWEHDQYAQALRSRGTYGGEVVELILPETFMNKSGETVRYLVEKEGVSVADFIVLHDEVDVPFGELKLTKGRGDGGNNGIKSIIQHLGTKEFARVRVGVASKHWWRGEARRPQGGVHLNKFVMGKFSFLERPQLGGVYKTVHEALAVLITDGLEKAMNSHN